MQCISICEVKKMILISSDKAVNPTNVMGSTKLISELILKYFQKRKNKYLFFNSKIW